MDACNDQPYTTEPSLVHIIYTVSQIKVDHPTDGNNFVKT